MTKIIDDYSFVNEEEMTDIELSFHFEHNSESCCSFLLEHTINNEKFFLEVSGVLSIYEENGDQAYEGQEIFNFLKDNKLSFEDLINHFCNKKKNPILDNFGCERAPYLYWCNEYGEPIYTKSKGDIFGEVPNNKIKAISLIDESYELATKIKHF